MKTNSQTDENETWNYSFNVPNAKVFYFDAIKICDLLDNYCNMLVIKAEWDGHSFKVNDI